MGNARRIRDEARHFDDARESASSIFEHRGEIRERLPGLRLERIAGNLPGHWIDSRLSRCVDEVPDANRL
jgi:hypothetical protein